MVCFIQVVLNFDTAGLPRRRVADAAFLLEAMPRLRWLKHPYSWHIIHQRRWGPKVVHFSVRLLGW